MQNSRILEMLEKGQIEELKGLIRDEIYASSLKNNPTAKKRYTCYEKIFKNYQRVKTNSYKTL